MTAYALFDEGENVRGGKCPVTVMFGLDGYHFKGVITRFRTTGHVLFRGEFSLEGV